MALTHSLYVRVFNIMVKKIIMKMNRMRQLRHMVWFCAYELQWTVNTLHLCNSHIHIKWERGRKGENKNYAVYCLIHCRPHYILLLLTFHISFLNNIHHHYELSNRCYYFVKKCAWPFIINSFLFFSLFVRIFHFNFFFFILLLSNCCCFCFALFHFSQRRRRRRLSIAIISYEKLTHSQIVWRNSKHVKKNVMRWAEKERAKKKRSRKKKASSAVYPILNTRKSRCYVCMDWRVIRLCVRLLLLLLPPLSLSWKDIFPTAFFYTWHFLFGICFQRFFFFNFWSKSTHAHARQPDCFATRILHICISQPRNNALQKNKTSISLEIMNANNYIIYLKSKAKQAKKTHTRIRYPEYNESNENEGCGCCCWYFWFSGIKKSQINSPKKNPRQMIKCVYVWCKERMCVLLFKFNEWLNE